MNDSSYLIAVGYPLGAALKSSEKTTHLIEINNKLNYLNFSAYKLWSMCLGGITAQKLCEFIETEDNNNLINNINYLEKKGLLLILDTNQTEGFFNRLRNYVGLRQGIGIGLKENNRYCVQFHELIELSEDEYIVWLLISNGKKLSVITQEYQYYQKDDQTLTQDKVVESFLFLISKGLVFLSEFHNK